MTFDSYIKNVEDDCWRKIHEATTEEALKLPEWNPFNPDEVLIAAKWAVGSKLFKREMQQSVLQAYEILVTIPPVRSALGNGDAELAAVRAVSLGFRIRERIAVWEWLEFEKWEDERIVEEKDDLELGRKTRSQRKFWSNLGNRERNRQRKPRDEALMNAVHEMRLRNPSLSYLAIAQRLLNIPKPEPDLGDVFEEVRQSKSPAEALRKRINRLEQKN